MQGKSLQAPKSRSILTKSRPILMSDPMVLALRGRRKTQTRRIVKKYRWQYGDGQRSPIREIYHDAPILDWEMQAMLPSCPYGRVGDLLWVREVWGHNDEYPTWDGDKLNGLPKSLNLEDRDLIAYWQKRVAYRATEPNAQYLINGGWRSPRFMPRWASRILLRVTEVRVERLQDISAEDAIAEGIVRLDGFGPKGDSEAWGIRDMVAAINPVLAYRTLWESINGVGSWERNPWAWVVGFELVEAGE